MNGLVYRSYDEIYLSIYDNKQRYIISEGTPITEGAYNNLKNNEIFLVDVQVKDGTLDLEVDDPQDLVDQLKIMDGYNIFFHMRNLSLYEYPFEIDTIIDNNEFEKIAKNILLKEKKKGRI
jgi:hypothetical protein